MGKKRIGKTDTSSCPGLRRFPCPRWRQRRTRVKASWRRWRTASIAGHGRRRPSASTESRGRPTSTPSPCAAPAANSSVSTAATSSSRQPTSTGSGPATARCAARRSASRSSARPARCASLKPTACWNAVRFWSPEIVLGQAQGGFAMGVGYALLESLPLYEDGPGNGKWNLGPVPRRARLGPAAP